MVFLSDLFMYNGISSKDMGVRLVTSSTGVLDDYGIPFEDSLRIEHSFGRNPFYSHEPTAPEKITLEFVLVDKAGQPIDWTVEYEEKILNWLFQDNFCEFISMDYPELYFYFKGVRVNRKRNYQNKGILSIEYQPYYKHPIKKIRSSAKVDGERIIYVNNPASKDEYVYPQLTINALSDGDIKIYNNSIDEEYYLEIKGLKEGETIKVDNEQYIVSGKNDENLFNKVNRHWFKLKKGDNQIRVVGNAKVTIVSNIEIRI